MKQLLRDNIPFLRFESYPENGRLPHAVFTRRGGISPQPFDSLNLSVSVPDAKSRVYANRKRAYGLFGRDTDSVVHAHLVHGADVARVTQAENGTWISRVDGIISNEVGCVLTMNFADCAPILVYDPINHAIGLGHSGWQGTVKDLAGALVRAMVTQFNSEPAQLIAGIGPCIGPCCYEVGEPVISAVQNAFVDAESLLLSTTGGAASVADGDSMDLPVRRHFDLPEANYRNLKQAGVNHIEQSGLCTGCRTDLFYSHRMEKGRTGRFGAVLMLA